MTRTNRGLRQPVGSLWPRGTRRAHNDEKRLAAQAVTNALKLGRLVRQPCEVCGDVNAQAHHDDYAKPLQVRWLCWTDHLARHGRTTHMKPYAPTRRRSLESALPIILAWTQQVRDEMDRQGLTQREFARLTGVTQPMVHRWFSAGFKTIGSLKLAADVLGLELPTLLQKRGQSTRVA